MPTGVQLADSLPGWGAVLLVTVTLLLVVAEVGFRLGRRHPTADDDRKTQAGVLIAALLALLGLLLAFSFSIVESRFTARKNLVLEEANAIETTWLRAAVLPAPHDERVQALLRAYVGYRVGRRTPEALDAAIRLSEDLHEDLWAEAVLVGERYPESEMVSLFMRSLNEVIDLHESRITVALHQRLPTPILLTLYVVSILSMAVLGYGAGLSRTRTLLPTTALVVAVSAVVVLIVELDRPMGRLIEVNQAALVDVREAMDREYQLDDASL